MKVFIIALFKSVLITSIVHYNKSAFLNIMKRAILKRAILIIKVFIISVYLAIKG